MPKVIKEVKIQKKDLGELKEIFEAMMRYDSLWKATNVRLKEKYGLSDDGNLRVNFQPERGIAQIIDLDQRGELKTDLEGTLGGGVDEIQYGTRGEIYNLKDGEVKQIDNLDESRPYIALVPEGVYQVKGSTLLFLLKSQLLHKDKMYQEMF